MTVAYLAEEFAKTGMKPVEKPWLPPLGTQITSPCAGIPENAEYAAGEKMDLKIPFGIVDIRRNNVR